MKRLFDQDFSTRLLALFLAIVIWFVVAADTNPRVVRKPTPDQPQVEVEAERLMDTPVEMRDLGKGFVAIPQPTSVMLTVRGSRTRIREAASQVKAYVSLSGLPEGRHILRVGVQHPPGLFIEGIDPPEVAVELQRVISKTVPITIAIFEFPGRGFLVSEPVAEPGQVTVTGPSGRVGRVQSAVARIDLASKVGTFEQVVEPRAVDASGAPVEGVTIYPSTVRVRAEIAGFTRDSGYPPRDIRGYSAVDISEP
ncbi:MAG TPA: hypothetical protein GXX51_03845 [Firmicutes bacterium]|nr:hypothetical protein [Bacillota bacterium]